MAALCEIYWPPLYAYIRRRGYSVDDAEDLTQAFFARLLEKDFLDHVRPERGKFRSFLLASLNHFLADEWDKSRAKKRGGGIPAISLDFAAAEGWNSVEPSHDITPDRVFERGWALTVLKRTLSRLEEEYSSKGRRELFDGLKDVLVRERGNIPYRQLGEKLNLSEGAVKVAVHRFRGRYRDALRLEIAQTVATEEDIEEEIAFLFEALGSAL